MNNSIIKSKIKKITDIRFRERKCFSIFSNKDLNPVYVIRLFYGQGILSSLYSACGQAFHARKNNMIPYVDMLHYKTQYKLKGKKNPWEAFFSQPPEFDEKYLDLNPPKILSRYSPPEYEVNNLFTQYDFGLYSEKKKVFDSLFRFSPDITDNLDRIAMDMNISDCIGVYARGTDYNALKPKNHHIQPSASQLIEKCDEYIKEHDLKIFLVTEDNSIYSEFLDYYGDRIVKFDEDIHFDSYSEKVPLHEKIMSYDSIHVAQVYIKKVLLLSKCKYLVGGKTSGSLWACIFNDEQYKDVYLFDNGVY